MQVMWTYLACYRENMAHSGIQRGISGKFFFYIWCLIQFLIFKNIKAINHKISLFID